MAPASSAMARHAASATRLLAVLQQHADESADLIGSDAVTFLAALEERDRVLGQLNGVVEAIVRERVATGRARTAQLALVKDIAQAAASALESHERLMLRARRERDRLAEAVALVDRPDPVADHYATFGVPRSAGLSVTG
jgi:hypothetical protein